MVSKVNPSITGSGRGTSDAALQTQFAQVAKELTELQNNSGGTRSSGVVRLGVNPTQGDYVTVVRRGVTRIYEFTNVAPVTGGLAVAIGAANTNTATNMGNVMLADKAALPAVSWTAYVIGSVVHVLASDDDEDALVITSSFTSGSNTVAVTNQGSKSGSLGSKHASFSHTPTAAEVTAGVIALWLNWAPTVAAVQVVTKSTHAKLAWDGAYTVTVMAADTALLAIDNSGAVDWSVNELVIVDAYG